MLNILITVGFTISRFYSWSREIKKKV